MVIRNSFIYLYTAILVFILSGAENVYAQVTLDRKFDIPIGQFENPFKVVTAGVNGLILYRDITEFETATDRTWELLHLDANLDVHFSTTLKTELSFDLISACVDGQFLYLLYKNPNSSQKVIDIIRLNLVTKNVNIISIKSIVPRVVNYFRVVNNTIILGGREKGKSAVIFYLDLSDRPINLQGIYGKKGKILDIFNDPENNICTILFRYRNPDGNWSVAVKSYDYNGKLFEETNIEPDGLIQLGEARTRIVGNRRIVAGTYSKRGNTASVGYFSAEITPRGSVDIKYFPLNTINVPDSLTETNIDSVEHEEAKKKPDIHKYMHVRDLRKTPAQLILLTETMHLDDMNPKNRENAGGKVRFIDGSLTSVDRHGELIWHYEYRLNGNYTDLEPKLSTFEQRNDTTLIMLHYRKSLALQKISNGELIEGFSYTDLDLLDVYQQFDQGFNDGVSELRPWYGPYYIFIGVINDPQSPENLTMISLRKIKIK